MNPFYKNLALWLVITLMMIMLYNLFSQQHLSESEPELFPVPVHGERRPGGGGRHPGQGAAT
ncbi:MAG: hypothetical protein MZV70_08935 [Desulfobacterales bacterium]|nr:hypothetical protein [Desulfobacterales bacterium]